MPPIATQSNARDIKPEVLRNEIIENVDQMERIEAGGDGEFASAMSVFPLVNLDDPDEEWYVMDGVRGPMDAVAYGSESPLGTLDLPSREGVAVQSYKKKYRPDKGTETELSDSPYSVYRRAAAVLRMELFLTREQITWRGDPNVEGLIGQTGTNAHSDIPADHVFTGLTPWSDSANATPYTDLTNAAYEVINNGRLFAGQATPTVFASPSSMRDLKQTADMEDRIANVRIKSVSTDDVQDLVDEEIGGFRRVMVYVPRRNANGEYVDETGTVVDDPDDAAHDNILDPYDPGTDTQVRNVIIMRQGAGTAFIPWFLGRLLERANNAPEPGNVSVDQNNGFFTQVWTDQDPIETNFKAAQEIGLKVMRGENIAILQDV